MILYPDGKVEGTPEEIAQWKKMQEQRAYEGMYKKLGTGGNDFINCVKGIISNNTKGKCPREGSACFCTGECLR